ncbi:MAG: hypothetical protein QF609_12780 [Gammaproteobacteria bacterium]|jgi:hypothetical protein|nr:hypothetical protein [Gammaproteobacteria bacterium]
MTTTCTLFDIGLSEGSRYRVDSDLRQAIIESNYHLVPRDFSIELQCRLLTRCDDDLVQSISEECRRKSSLIDPDRVVRTLLCEIGPASRARVEAGRAVIEHTLRSFHHVDEACRPIVMLTSTDGMPAILAELNADPNILEIVVRAESFAALRSLFRDLPKRGRTQADLQRATQWITIWVTGNAAPARISNDATAVENLLQRRATQCDAVSVIAPLLRAGRSGRPDSRGVAAHKYCAGLLRAAASLNMEWVAPGTFLTSPVENPSRLKMALFDALDALDASDDGDVVALGPGAVSRVGNTYFVNHRARAAYQRDIARGGQGVQWAFKVAESEALRRAIMSRLTSRAIVSLSDEATKAQCTGPAVCAAFDEVLTALANERRVARLGRGVFGLHPGDEIHLGEVYRRLLPIGSRVPAIADIR